MQFASHVKDRQTVLLTVDANSAAIREEKKGGDRYSVKDEIPPFTSYTKGCEYDEHRPEDGLKIVADGNEGVCYESSRSPGVDQVEVLPAILRFFALQQRRRPLHNPSHTIAQGQLIQGD